MKRHLVRYWREFLAGALSMLALLLILGTGPSTITIPLSGSYRVTTAADGSFASTFALCDINNPATCISLGQQAMTGSVPVAIASNQSNVPINNAQVGGTAVDTNSGVKSAGTQRVVLATDQPTLTNPFSVNLLPSTSAGWSPFLANAQSTTVTTVKATAGELGAYYCWNPNAAVAYLQIFDISGTVTLGTSVPKWSIGLPAGSAANLELSNGLHFANAIKIAATTTATGSTAPTSAIDCNIGFN